MNAALRQEQHKIGRVHLIDGDYASALLIFERALQNFGPHVGLLSDIITSYYFLGRIEECAEKTRMLHHELESSKLILSEKSFVRTSIFLGKMWEEQANVAKALAHYEEASARSYESADLKIQAQIQLLRLKAFLGIRSGLSEIYQTCMKYRAETHHLNVELEHGLMLAELCLFGPIAAYERLLAISRNEELIAQ
ncbi:MAG: hypothetical protein EOP06_27705, partial [Proteobacteria bacterium]